MRIRPSTGILFFLACTLPACQPAPEQTEADIAAIQALAETWGVAAEAGDIDALLALRTDDVVQYPPEAPIARGKQALEEFYRGLFTQFSVFGSFDGTAEIVVDGGWAFFISGYTLRISPKAGGDPVEEQGKIILICEKQPDGSWLWAHEIWNRNSPLGDIG